MLIRRVGREWRMEFPYNPKIIAAIREEFPKESRRFDYLGKHWYISDDAEGIMRAFAFRWGFAVEEVNEPEQDFTIKPLREPESELEARLQQLLKYEPYRYQMQGIQYAYDAKRCIIGDKPGVGKTLQAIGAVILHNAFPCLVICPDDPGPDNWQREWEKATGKRARVITPKLIRHLNHWVEADAIHVFIVGYSSLKKYFVDEIKRKPDTKKFTLRDITFNSRKNIFRSVIVDESHYCAKFDTMRTKLVKGIAAGKEIRYLLSGTAMVNKPMDLAPQLGIIDRLNDLGGYKFFRMRYCAGDGEATNLRELNYRMSEICFFSRNKEEVLKDLPPKVRQVVYVDLDDAHRREYEEAEANMMEYLKKWKDADDEQVERAMRGETMVRIGICKDIAARGKLAGVKNFIRAAIDGEDKMVVFLHQHAVLHAMTAEFPDALTLTGLTDKRDRMPVVDTFQEDPDKRLILVGMKVGGELITLHASSHVGFIELGWNPAKHDQCEDRCHRNGQKDSVLCTYFLARDTIDVWNYFDVIESKRRNSDLVLNGTSGEVETNILQSLAEASLNKKQTA